MNSYNLEISTISTKKLDETNFSSISSHPAIDELPTPFDDYINNNKNNSDETSFEGETMPSQSKKGKSKVDEKIDVDKMGNKVISFWKSDKIKDFSLDYLSITIICIVLVGLVLLVYYFYGVMGIIFCIYISIDYLFIIGLRL